MAVQSFPDDDPSEFSYVRMLPEGSIENYALGDPMDSDLGHAIIPAETPPKELYAEVEDSIPEFHSLRRASSDQSGQRFEGNDACRRLLHHGIDYSKVNFFEKSLGQPYGRLVKSQPYITFLMRNEVPPPRYYLGNRHEVYIYRSATPEVLSVANGLFSVIDRSHRQSPGEYATAVISNIELLQRKGK